MFKIKICGIKDCKTVVQCSQFGGDAIGLNFYAKSKRFVPVTSAVEIASKAPKSLKKVGLFVNHSAAEIRSVSQQVGLDLIQLHGNESITLLEELESHLEDNRQKVVRAVRMSPENSETALSQIEQWDQGHCADLVGAFLLDAFRADSYGGTGETIDWNWLSELDLPTEKPVILAGGLNPFNVERAIEQIQPFGVDVAGGVESVNGVKDHAKIEQFVKNARRSFNRV
ncbi:MAG: phosphoribosylanthranilate isomerase [Planctomycetota bacterium]|nr:phosphoribosylanthranilate isomerase [Planctomycetota bacterium]